MKHSNYMFSECQACAEIDAEDRSQFAIRNFHWRKAARELEKQRDALLEAAEDAHAFQTAGGNFCFTCEQHSGRHIKTCRWAPLAAAIALTKGDD